MSLPVNHRAKWTKTEFNNLLRECKKTTPISEIAKLHKRTVSAIKYKLYRHAMDLADENEDITWDELIYETNLPKYDLIDGFTKLKFDFEHIQTGKLPANHQTKWTDSDVKKFNTYLKNNVKIDEIALNLDRTIGAIKYKIIRQVIKLMGNKSQTFTWNDLIKFSKLTKIELIELFNNVNYDFSHVQNDSVNLFKNVLYKGVIYLLYIKVIYTVSLVLIHLFKPKYQ